MKTLQIFLCGNFNKRENFLKTFMLTIILLMSVSAGFCQPVKLSFAELINQSDLIFVGTVESQNCRMNDKNTMIFTDVVFKDVEVINSTEKSFSKRSAIITLTYAGGSYDGTTVQVSEMPCFLTVKRYLLFIKDDGEVYANPIIGASQGLFEVITDKSDKKEYILSAGRKIVMGLEGSELVLSNKKVTGIHNSIAEYESGAPENTGLITTLPAGSDNKCQATARNIDTDVQFDKPMTKAEFINNIMLCKKDNSYQGLKNNERNCQYQKSYEEIICEKVPAMVSCSSPSSVTFGDLSGSDDQTDGITSTGEIEGGQLGWCGYQNLRLGMQQVDKSWKDYNIYNNCMYDWNQTMDVFGYYPWDGSYGPNNGTSEFYSFWSDNTLYQTFGMHWGTSIGKCFWWGDGDCGRIKESDIILNQEESWVYQADEAINTNNILLAPVVMHELGHSWGAQRPPAYPETYDYDVLTVMHPYYFDIYETGRGIHRSDAYMFRRDYDNQTSILSKTDIGVESYYASNGLHKSTTDASSYRGGEDITINNITIENMSYNSVSDLTIRFYLSTNRNISTNDYKIGSDWSWSTFSGESYYVGNFTQYIPTDIPTGNYYVGIIVTVNGLNNDDFTYNNSTCLSDPVYVRQGLGISQSETTNSYSFYPNPVKNELMVESKQNNLTGKSNFSICDLTGKILLEGEISTGLTKIDFSQLTSGMYIIRINSETNVITRRLIKE
jgi:hypothetical protein